MTTTKHKKTAPVKTNPNKMTIVNDKGKSDIRKLAEIGLSAPTLNAVTARNFSRQTLGESDLTETIHVMQEKVAKVNAGDLSELETTLVAQSVSLDAMFNELARRAVINMGEHLHATESYMRLALKAQAQCARTIEVLANIKNPPIVYAKQMNVANGNQQVNNGSNANSTHPPAHAEKIINQPNELLSENSSETMDTRGTATTSRADKAMATLAT